MTGWIDKARAVIGLVSSALAVGLVFSLGALIGFILTFPIWH